MQSVLRTQGHIRLDSLSNCAEWQCDSHHMILLMEEVLHHLGCIKPSKNNRNYLATGAGFLPSTVAWHYTNWNWAQALALRFENIGLLMSFLVSHIEATFTHKTIVGGMFLFERFLGFSLIATTKAQILWSVGNLLGNSSFIWTVETTRDCGNRRFQAQKNAFTEGGLMRVEHAPILYLFTRKKAKVVLGHLYMGDPSHFRALPLFGALWLIS